MVIYGDGCKLESAMVTLVGVALAGWLSFLFPLIPLKKPLLLLFFLKLCKLYTHIPINLSLLSFILKSTQYYNLFVISAPPSQKPLLLLLSPNNANFLLTSQLTSLFYLSSWNRPNIIKYIETPCEALPARLSQLQTSITICLSKKSTRFVEARSK